MTRLRIVAVLVISLGVGGHSACRRSQDAPIDLDAGIAAARELEKSKGPRAALPEFERLLAAANAQHSRRHEGLLLGHIGTTYKNLADFRRAMAFHERALAIKRELGDEIEVAKTLSNMGLVEWKRGECRRALALYAQSLPVFERRGQSRFAASVLNNEGLCFDELGEFGRSVPAFERALALHRQNGNDTGESEALGNLGGVALQLGRYAEAVRLYQESLAISRRLDDRQSMVLDLINLGHATLGAGDRRAARAHLEEARRLAREAGLANEEADALEGLSAWLSQAGRYDEARAALTDAAAIYARAGLALEKVEATLDLGALDLETGDLGAASRQFAAAASAAAELKFFGGALTAQIAIAQLELKRHNAVAARAAADRAIALAASNDDVGSGAAALTWKSRALLEAGDVPAALDAAREANAQAERAKGVVLQADAQLALGDVLLTAGRAGDARSAFEAAGAAAGADLPDLAWRAAYGVGSAREADGRLEDALGSYRRAVAIIEGVRSQLSSSRARGGYLDDRRDAYAAVVRVLLRLGRTREAFEAAERLRTQGYRELLQRSLLLSTGGVGAPPAPLLTRIRQLQAAIEAERQKRPDDQRGAALATYEEDLRAADAIWRSAVDAAAAKAPWVRALVRADPPPAASVQQRLPPRTALVEFVVDRERTLAFVLTRGELRAAELPLRERDLRNRIELLRGLLARRDADGWQRMAERLDADLLAPLRSSGWLDGISRLYVVPHAELNYLPFALLRHSTPTGPRYVVDDMAIVWVPAASALVPDGAMPSPGRGLLALAPARARLPFAREEVESVARLFRGPQVLAGEAATEARFKRDVGAFRIVHLATHGSFNRVNPLFSGLQLEPGGDDDGELQVFEILGVRLRADLVALSACDTAMAGGELTDLPAGEELVGLARAFLSAGARHVLATLWAINDRSTAGLMTEFYQAAQRQPVPEALAAVQRRRAHAGGSDADPWTWAPFVVAAGGTAAETALTSP